MRILLFVPPRAQGLAPQACVCERNLVTLQAQTTQGSLAEWLGTGLQNRLRRFDSARNLRSRAPLSDKMAELSAFISPAIPPYHHFGI